MAANITYCQRCGNPHEKGALYCSVCGASLTPGAPPPPPAKEAPQIQLPVAPQRMLPTVYTPPQHPFFTVPPTLSLAFLKNPGTRRLIISLLVIGAVLAGLLVIGWIFRAPW